MPEEECSAQRNLLALNRGGADQYSRVGRLSASDLGRAGIALASPPMALMMAARSSSTATGWLTYLPVAGSRGARSWAAFMSMPVWYLTVALASFSSWPVRMQTT